MKSLSAEEENSIFNDISENEEEEEMVEEEGFVAIVGGEGEGEEVEEVEVRVEDDGAAGGKKEEFEEKNEDLFYVDSKPAEVSLVSSGSGSDDTATAERQVEDSAAVMKRKPISFYYDHKNICRNWNTWGCEEDHSSVTNRQHICLSCGSKDHSLILSKVCNTIEGDPAALVKAHVAHCKNRVYFPQSDNSVETRQASQERPVTASAKPVPEELGNPVTFEGCDPAILSNCPSGSKLQILNLPLSYPIDSKRELAAIFSQYGEILDISFSVLPKVIHGFIQFTSPEILAAAIKAEDRREMALGFKLDLADEYKRSIEKAKLAAKASDLLDHHPSQRSNPSSLSSSARKREGSPPPHPSNTFRNKRGGGSGYSSRDRRDYSPEPSSSARRINSRDRDNYNRPPSRHQQPDSYRPSPITFSGYNAHPVVPVGNVHDVQLIGLQDVQDSFVEHVEQRCTNANLRWKTTFLSYRDDIAAKVRQFHQMGVFGVFFLERRGEMDRTVALQLFSLQSAQSQEFFKLSVSEAVVCMSNEKKKRQTANPANQMAQLLSLAAQANVPLEYLQQQAVYSSQVQTQGYQPPMQFGRHQPYQMHPPQQQQQQQHFPTPGQSLNYSVANSAQMLVQPQPTQLNQLLNAFTSNQSLLNNLNLLQQQQQPHHLKK